MPPEKLNSHDLTSSLTAVLSQIDAAATRSGRKPSDIQLVLATKTQGADRMNQAAQILRAAGHEVIFGENYVQEFAAKREGLEPPYKAELIGHLQSNKARKAVAIFDRVQSLDSVGLAKTLNAEAQKVAKRLPVLIQVNISVDAQKSGVARDHTRALLEVIVAECPNLLIEGLMAITALIDNPDLVRLEYRALSKLREQLERECKTPLPWLSMGMSHDFSVAIEEGATIVRVGSAIFGARMIAE